MRPHPGRDRSGDISAGNDVTVASPFPTAIGPVTVIWHLAERGPRVERVVLPGAPVPVPGEAGAPARGRELVDRRIRVLISGVRRFLDGKDVRFDPGLLDLDRCPPFQRRVLLAEHGIPRGYVSTYGLIAGHLGNPRAARAVGGALAWNPFPLVIPCHRAVRSDGSLGGFQGGPALKRRLLELEGIGIREDGRVTMDRVWYRDQPVRNL